MTTSSVNDQIQLAVAETACLRLEVSSLIEQLDREEKELAAKQQELAELKATLLLKTNKSATEEKTNKSATKDSSHDGVCSSVD